MEVHGAFLVNPVSFVNQISAKKFGFRTPFSKHLNLKIRWTVTKPTPSVDYIFPWIEVVYDTLSLMKRFALVW